MRRCSICKQYKPETDFYKEKRRKRVNLTCRCKDCLNGMRRVSYRKNFEREKINGKQKRIEYLNNWKAFLIDKYGDEPECAICSKPLQWFSKNGSTAVCFDHRTYDGTISGVPKHWIQSKPCTEQNMRIFESHKFGILCRLCNAFLGKKDRIQKLINLDIYLQDENICKS